MKILAIGAHPDDIEIFMYGFLSVCLKRGDEIYTIIATDGSAGKVFRKKNLKLIREKETFKGLSKFSKPIFLGFISKTIPFTGDLIDLYPKRTSDSNSLASN